MLAVAEAERSRVGFARAFCGEAVSAYWESAGITVEIPVPADESLPAQSLVLTVTAAEVARRLGTALAALPATEACYQLGSTYAAMLPDATRTQRGVYYTPPALVERLLEQAEIAGIDWRTARVLDPAAGAGVFLLAVARRMVRAIGRADRTIIGHNVAVRLRGWEIDPFAAWLGNVFLTSELRSFLKPTEHRVAGVNQVRDSLAYTAPEAGFDLVVGNPPFGRVSLSEAARRRYERSLYGHANLYNLFMDLAATAVRQGGLISFVTPTSFLAGEYFKKLRELLWRDAPPANLDFVTARKGVFESVLQETVLATYVRGARRAPAKVYFIEAPGDQPVTLKRAGAFTLPADPTAPWILARDSDSAPLARRLREMRHRLADWGYSVSTGPLVWNRHKTQLTDVHDGDCVPLVWAEAVTSDGRFVLRSEKKNHKPFFKPLAGDDWLIVRTPCVLLQRTTAKEQARRLIAAEMPSDLIAEYGGVTVENHLNMLLPIGRKPKINPAVLAAFLNTGIADRAFRCLSGSVAVSAYELEALPLPAPESAESLCRLVRRKAPFSAIEIGAASLYGLSIG